MPPDSPMPPRGLPGFLQEPVNLTAGLMARLDPYKDVIGQLASNGIPAAIVFFGGPPDTVYTMAAWNTFGDTFGGWWDAAKNALEPWVTADRFVEASEWLEQNRDRLADGASRFSDGTDRTMSMESVSALLDDIATWARGPVTRQEQPEADPSSARPPEHEPARQQSTQTPSPEQATQLQQAGPSEARAMPVQTQPEPNPTPPETTKTLEPSPTPQAPEQTANPPQETPQLGAPVETPQSAQTPESSLTQATPPQQEQNPTHVETGKAPVPDPIESTRQPEPATDLSQTATPPQLDVPVETPQSVQTPESSLTRATPAQQEQNPRHVETGKAPDPPTQGSTVDTQRHPEPPPLQEPKPTQNTHAAEIEPPATNEPGKDLIDTKQPGVPGPDQATVNPAGAGQEAPLTEAEQALRDQMTDRDHGLDGHEK